MRFGFDNLANQIFYCFCEVLQNKTRVLLCKRLSGQCRDVYMVVYFHLHWWWWAVVDCAVLGCTGMNWAVLDCTGLY